MAAASLIPELDDIVKNGTAKRRAEAIERISELFLEGASRYHSEHVELFDDILVGLVPTTEIDTRAELAARLSRVDNAPPTLLNQLAREDEITIAGPILTNSPLLDEPTLVEIARKKGQSHLAAISERPTLATSVTDVILRRGDRDVVRTVAANDGAQFSEGGYAGLVNRATDDGVLAVTVGRRDDISPASLKELLSKSEDSVRRDLLDAVDPERKAAINEAIAEIASTQKLVQRDFGPAQRAVLALSQAGTLNEKALLEFARQHKYEEAIAAFSALSGMRLPMVHQLVQGDREDPILLLAKSSGMEWTTVRALIMLRLGPGKTMPPPDIEEARVNYDRLSLATAERVLAFWRAREKTKPV